jgi:hypothetical protein
MGSPNRKARDRSRKHVGKLDDYPLNTDDICCCSRPGAAFPQQADLRRPAAERIHAPILTWSFS